MRKTLALFIFLLCMLSLPALAESTLTLPASLTAIEDEAFLGDQSLDAVVLPDGVASIGARAFQNSSVKQIHLPESITFIGEDAFAGAVGVTATVAENSYAHQWCVENGVDINIIPAPNSLYAYADNGDGTCTIVAYMGNEFYITIPNAIDGLTVTTLKKGLFAGNQSIIHLTIPETVQSIPAFLCDGCSNLTFLTYDAPVCDSIGDYAFRNCVSLYSAYVDSHSVGIGAFQGCTSLVYITINQGSSIGAHAYDGCTSLKEVYYYSETELKIIGEYAFRNCTGLINLMLPLTLDVIGEGAFEGCTALCTLRLPDDVSSIAADAFDPSITVQCHTGTLTEETLISTGIHFDPIDAYLYCDLGDGTCTITDYTGYESDLVIPSQLDGLTVTGIGEKAFAMGAGVHGTSSNSQLTSVVIPEGVTWIGEHAFCLSAGLQQVIFPDGLKTIGPYAFASCNLQWLELPDGVVTIDEFAFYENMALVEINLPASLNDLGAMAFSETKVITLDDSNSTYQVIDNVLYTKDGKKLVMYPSAVKGSYVVPEGVTTITRYAFSECGITEVVMPSTLRSIEENAFFAANVTHVYLNNGLEAIGERAFLDSNLESIQIPEGITEIPDRAFGGCLLLKSIGFPSSITRIGKEAFLFCESLQSLTLPDHISEIDTEAFTCNFVDAIPWAVPHTLYVNAGTTTEKTLAATGLAYEILPAAVTE